MTDLAWVATDARTGRVLAELPDLEVRSVSRTIGTYTSTTATLPLAGAPANWLRATLPRAAALVLLVDGRPVWGGDVTRRDRDNGDAITLSLASFEAYLDLRYVGGVRYTGVGQNLVVADLVDRYVVDTTADAGRPLRVEVLDGPGSTRDRWYDDGDDKTVLSVLQELSGVVGGPEWTVVWEHRTGPERYTPVLQVGSRVGRAVPAGLGPAATFDLPGSVTATRLVEDWAHGRGATSVVAVSTADGDLRPQSRPRRSGDPERPLVEYRWTPSTSITTTAVLEEHAARALAALSRGSVALELTADLSAAPTLGRDWDAGDDVGYVIGGVDQHGHETVPAFPGGLSGTARAIGWTLELDGSPTVTPVLSSDEWSTS